MLYLCIHSSVYTNLDKIRQSVQNIYKGLDPCAGVALHSKIAAQEAKSEVEGRHVDYAAENAKKAAVRMGLGSLLSSFDSGSQRLKTSMGIPTPDPSQAEDHTGFRSRQDRYPPAGNRGVEIPSGVQKAQPERASSSAATPTPSQRTVPNQAGSSSSPTPWDRESPQQAVAPTINGSPHNRVPEPATQDGGPKASEKPPMPVQSAEVSPSSAAFSSRPAAAIPQTGGVSTSVSGPYPNTPVMNGRPQVILQETEVPLEQPLQRPTSAFSGDGQLQQSAEPFPSEQLRVRASDASSHKDPQYRHISSQDHEPAHSSIETHQPGSSATTENMDLPGKGASGGAPLRIPESSSQYEEPTSSQPALLKPEHKPATDTATEGAQHSATHEPSDICQAQQSGSSERAVLSDQDRLHRDSAVAPAASQHHSMPLTSQKLHTDPHQVSMVDSRPAGRMDDRNQAAGSTAQQEVSGQGVSRLESRPCGDSASVEQPVRSTQETPLTHDKLVEEQRFDPGYEDDLEESSAIEEQPIRRIYPNNAGLANIAERIDPGYENDPDEAVGLSSRSEMLARREAYEAELPSIMYEDEEGVH